MLKGETDVRFGLFEMAKYPLIAGMFSSPVSVLRLSHPLILKGFKLEVTLLNAEISVRLYAVDILKPPIDVSEDSPLKVCSWEHESKVRVPPTLCSEPRPVRSFAMALISVRSPPTDYNWASGEKSPVLQFG